MVRRTLIAVLAACAGSASPAVAQAELGGSHATAAMRRHAEAIAHRYLAGWSSGNAQALADARALYGPRVNFYGRFITQGALFDQKRRFGERWPIRRYAHRPGTMRISCDIATEACLVKSIVDWQAISPGRGAASGGASTFELGIGFSGPRPVVLFERGRVLTTSRYVRADG